MKIYYARPRCFAGTKIENEDLATLRSLGFDVIDPYLEEHQALCKKDNTTPMSYFRELASTADGLAFRSFSDGKVGAGVAAEIASLRVKKPRAPVIELSGNIISERLLTQEETAHRNKTNRI